MRCQSVGVVSEREGIGQVTANVTVVGALAALVASMNAAISASLATVLVVGFWSSLWIAWGLGNSLVLIETVAFLLLLIVFEDEHAFHWRLWGDSLIAETYALLWRSKK